MNAYIVHRNKWPWSGAYCSTYVKTNGKLRHENRYVKEVEDYYLGISPPHYPMPALKLVTETCPAWADSPYHNSVILWHIYKCDCCEDNYTWSMACIWDFDFDRSTDFNYGHGVYVNSREIQEGTELYSRFGKAGGHA